VGGSFNLLIKNLGGLIIMCGLYGFINYSDKEFKGLDAVVELLGKSSAVRGTDATGIAYNMDGKLHIDKDAKSAYQFKFDVPDSSKVVIGHTRKTTQGNQKKNYNNHPFRGKIGETNFALAHNGVIHNDLRLRNQLKLEKPKIETDSYVAVQLIEKHGTWGIDALKYAGEMVEGMFSFTLMDDQDNWYLVKNDSPLVMLHFPELGVYVYASTQTILFEAILYSSALSSEIISPFKTGVVSAVLLEPKAGDIWKINSKTGELEKSTFKPSDDRRYYGNGYGYNSCYWDDYDCGYGRVWDAKANTWKESSTSRKSTTTISTTSTTSTAASTTKKEKSKYDPAKEANRLTDKEYYDMLLQVAEGMGHDRKDIRILKNYGYGLDEIEQALFDRTLDLLLEEAKQVVGDKIDNLAGDTELDKGDIITEDGASVNQILNEVDETNKRAEAAIASATGISSSVVIEED
jgi:predicted glutamine amidotransferase